MTDPYQHAVFFVAIAVAAIGAVIDWHKGEIPSWVTTPAMRLAPFLHFARYKLAHETAEDSLYEAALALGGGARCAIVPLILYRQSAVGGGDLKLFVALGALLQPRRGVEAQMYSFFAGAILAPAKLAYGLDGREVQRRAHHPEGRHRRAGRRLPGAAARAQLHPRELRARRRNAL